MYKVIFIKCHIASLKGSTVFVIPLPDIKLWEEELDLPGGGLLAVRAVPGVPGVGQPKLSSDGMRVTEPGAEDLHH